MSSTTQRNTTPNTGNNTSPRTSTTPSATPSPLFKKFLYYAWLIAQSSVLLFTLGYLIKGYPFFFYKALLAGCIAYSIPVFNSFEGSLQMNMAMAQRLMANENSQFVVYCMIFYFLGNVSLVYLMPNFIYSFYHILKLVIPYSVNIPFVHGLLEKVNATNQKAIDFAISIEVNILLIAFFSIFSSLSNVLLVFIYFRYLGLRYAYSSRIKAKVNEYSQMADYLAAHEKCPLFIRNIIPKIKYYLSK